MVILPSKSIWQLLMAFDGKITIQHHRADWMGTVAGHFLGAEEVAAWKEAASWRHRDDDSEKPG
jgi:hypothetical protein